jgi:protein-tyrosine phosphatase
MAEIRVLTVCSHNRTRSVLMGAMLEHHLRGLGVGVDVRTAGFGDAGLPPTDQAARHLAELGIPTDQLRSRRLEADDVRWADVIVTAERLHVVEIAARWPEAFGKSFTLGEIVQLASAAQPDGDGDGNGGDWITALGTGRSPATYLDGLGDDDLADPTGGSPADWRRAITTIDELTGRLSGSLSERIGGTS